eukprot:scaffold454536_cov25-Prasinocladus_malaysianus.AAC.1
MEASAQHVRHELLSKESTKRTVRSSLRLIWRSIQITSGRQRINTQAGHDGVWASLELCKGGLA